MADYLKQFGFWSASRSTDKFRPFTVVRKQVQTVGVRMQKAFTSRMSDNFTSSHLLYILHSVLIAVQHIQAANNWTTKIRIKCTNNHDSNRTSDSISDSLMQLVPNCAMRRVLEALCFLSGQ